MLLSLVLACQGTHESTPQKTGTDTAVTDSQEDTEIEVIDDSGETTTTTTTEDTAASYQDYQDFYDPTVLHTVELLLEQADLDALTTAPETYVEADVTIDGTPVSKVGVRLKGNTKDNTMLVGKPSLKLSFDEYKGKQTYGQMKEIYLDSMNGDDSQSQQVIAYWLWNKAGMLAPRASMVKVSYVVDGDTANAVYLGLYANIEVIDKAFVTHHLTDPTGDLWAAGDSGAEFTNAGIQNFSLEAGDGSVVSLQDVWQTVWMQGDFYDNADTVLQMDQFLEYWSWRIILGAGDGYPYELDDFYLYADPSEGGRMSFAPWDMEKSWNKEMTWSDLAGVVSVKCYNDSVCLTDLKARVTDDLDVYDGADPAGFAAELNTLTDDAAYQDTRRAEKTPYTVVSSARTTLSYTLSNQTLRVKQAMGLH